LGLPPGSNIVPATVVPGTTTLCTDGEPTFPVGTVLPACLCPLPVCPCVESFSCVTGELTLNGIKLTVVTDVKLIAGASCDPTLGTS